MYCNSFSLHQLKRPGAILHPGTIVARVELDDESSVKQAVPFTGTLPTSSPEQKSHGEKVNQVRNDRKKGTSVFGHCASLEYTPSPM